MQIHDTWFALALVRSWSFPRRCFPSWKRYISHLLENTSILYSFSFHPTSFSFCFRPFFIYTLYIARFLFWNNAPWISLKIAHFCDISFFPLHMLAGAWNDGIVFVLFFYFFFIFAVLRVFLANTLLLTTLTSLNFGL